MPTAVIMPKFEMAQETGTVGRWVVQEGQTVAKGDVILEVETDKVTMEVESPAAGRLAGICAAPGQVVPIGQVIAYILKPGETLPKAAPLPEAAPLPQPAAATAPSAAEQPAADKPAAAKVAGAATPVAARVAAAHGLDLAGVSGTGPQGRVTRDDVEAHLAAQAPAGAPAPATALIAGKIVAVPAARRLARELGVDLAHVRGTGPDGRIQSDDVRHAAARAAAATPAPQPPAVAPAAPGPFPGMPAEVRKIPLTNVRRTIAERMAASTRDIPQFTVSLDVDMGRAVDFIEDLRAVAQGDPGTPKITLTALLVKACAWTLRRHPGANASFAGDHIVEWSEVNIGIATAADQGLVVPVIRAVDRLGLLAIAEQLAALSGRARENRLRLDDIQGGTFTISNLGMFGIDRFTAIVNPPQAAILAVGRVAKRPVVAEDGSLVARPLATLTLTADHRVLDGATAAQSLNTLQKVLEHPSLLLA